MIYYKQLLNKSKSLNTLLVDYTNFAAAPVNTEIDFIIVTIIVVYDNMILE